MKQIKNSTRFLASVAGMVATVSLIGSAQAVLVSYSLTSNGSVTGQTGAGATEMGGSATDQWMTEVVTVDADGNTVDDVVLNDVSGAATVATVSHFGLRRHNPAGQVVGTGNPVPLQASTYMRHNNESSFLLFEGLQPGSTADIALFGTYHLNGINRGTSFTAGGTTLSTTGAAARTSLNNGGNYVFFDDVLIGPSGSIQVDITDGPGGNGFSDFNGFQIDFTPVPEPSVALLGGLGLLGLLRRRR
ncbi:MAG: PEP-CTERM sorting domain-containing protein [Verrucomicrobiota bacterium]